MTLQTVSWQGRSYETVYVGLTNEIYCAKPHTTVFAKVKSCFRNCQTMKSDLLRTVKGVKIIPVDLLSGFYFMTVQ